MKDTILYIGSFQFPYGDAIAKRVHGVGKALSLTGYSVVFIGEDKQVAPRTLSPERQHEVFTYYALHKPCSAVEHYDYRQDLKLIKAKIDQYAQTGKLAAVFFCGTKNAFFADGIVKHCKKRGIPTVADSMDWLTARTGNILFDCIKQFDVSYELKKVNRQADGVMAISTMLQNVYASQGKPTVCVPPISPYSREEAAEQVCSGKIQLVYAGIPCRLGQPLKNKSDAKDRLDVVIDVLYAASKAADDFGLAVYGLTQADYLQVFPEQIEKVEALSKQNILAFKGYTNEAVVRNAVMQADYTILFRETNITSMAGFPTKISESIHLGTPVITTDTSDILNYVEEGCDAIILDIAQPEAACSKLIDMIRGGRVQSKAMKANARKNNSFEPETYAKQLDVFVKKLSRED